MPTDVCEKCDSDRRWSVGGARVIENWRKLPLSLIDSSYHTRGFVLSHFALFSFVFFFERERHTRSKIERELLSRSSAEVIED